jgi:hypothetical protein
MFLLSDIPSYDISPDRTLCPEGYFSRLWLFFRFLSNCLNVILPTGCKMSGTEKSCAGD